MRKNNTTSNNDDARKNIALVLKRRHKMTSAEAEEAINISPFSAIFQDDPDMAAHTSNEAWARQIFNYWKKFSGKE